MEISNEERTAQEALLADGAANAMKYAQQEVEIRLYVAVEIDKVSISFARPSPMECETTS